MNEVNNPAVRDLAERVRDLAVRVRDQWKSIPVKVRSLAYFAVTLVIFSVLWFGVLPDVVIDLVVTWQHLDTAGRTRLVVFGIGALFLMRSIVRFTMNATRPEPVCSCHRGRTDGDR